MKYKVTRGCTFCGTCVFECPAGAIVMGPEGAVIDPGRCTGCGVCFENCASEAITRETDGGEKRTEGTEND